MESKLDKLNKLVKEDSKNPKESIFSNATGKIFDILIDKIVTNPYQPRVVFAEEEINELAESINKNGLLNPILVSDDGNEKYTLIAGERRLRATKILGEKTINAIVYQKVSHAKLASYALVENIEREQLHPIEIALNFGNLINEKIFKNQNEIVENTGLSKSTISKYIGMTKLSTELITVVQKSKYRDIEVISSLKNIDDEKAKEILNEIISKELNRKSALELIKSIKNNKKDSSKSTIYLNKKGRISLKLNLSQLPKEKQNLIDNKIKEILSIVDKT